MKILLLTATNPSPTLKNPEKWSNNFSNLIDSCLKKDPKLRISSTEFLFHSFFENLSRDAVHKYMDFIYVWKENSETI